jgi:hypothetical protein
MNSGKAIFNHPFNDGQFRVLVSQVIQMGEDIKKENIGNLDDHAQRNQRITTWIEYIKQLLEKILKPSTLLSQKTQELSSVNFDINCGDLEQGNRETVDNIDRILKIITGLADEITAISKRQEMEMDGKFADIGIPATPKAFLLRTDYADEIKWKLLIGAIRDVNAFQSRVEIIIHDKLASATPEELIPLVRDRTNYTHIFVADSLSMNHPEKPILVVDVFAAPGRSFRVIASKLLDVHDNLSVANLDFDDYLEIVDKENIYRG